MRLNSRQYGFTLIELIVAVVIVAILARIAYPVYQDQVNRARRAEGKAALLKAAQLQERNYTNGDPNVANSSPRYVDSGVLAQLFGLANGAVIYSGENPGTATGWYTITVDAWPNAGCNIAALAGQEQCFQLRATPNAARSFVDAECGELTLDSAGRRTESGTRTVAECWDR